ncbi:hypothetical protein [Peribacillus alkalitolerans]|uniref:hypothetical protein n=1 Tax=Peribacillus alkalitolerans TaxID=1550385 RepID=UPI0013D5CAD8|nr:hypothetical protein [Peribacillus alkalitolerans]
MEKTLVIDGKQVRIKSTGATALRYKAQFGKDYLSEILKLNALGKLNVANLEANSLDGVDFEVFYNIVWTMAKSADSSIADPITWLDGFDEFPLFDIIPELQDMIMSTIQGKKK